MNQSEAIEVARKYLFADMYQPKHPFEEYKLHRSLQYLLCGSYQRLERNIGQNNITEKDIYLLVEAWIMVEGCDIDYESPLIHKDIPSNTLQRNK